MPSGDSVLLASAISTASTEAIASILALLEETTVGAILSCKLNDWSEKRAAGESLAKALEKKAAQYRREPKPELLLLLYARLNSIAGLKPRAYASPHDFADNCEELAEAAMTLARKHDKGFTGSSLNDLVQHQAGIMFGQMAEDFRKLDPEGQKEFLGRIREYVASLPEEQRKILLEKLNVTELSDESLTKVITGGALGSAFAAAVGIGGFSFYMGASSLMAGMAGIVGITLPFGFYTALSSSIAVLANPLFLMAAIGGGAWFLITGANSKIREKMLPLVISSLVVSSVAGDGDGSDGIDEAIALWQGDWQKVLDCREKVDGQQAALTLATRAHSSTKAALRQTDSDLKQAKRLRGTLVERISGSVRTHLDIIELGRWGDDSVADASELRSLLQDIAEVDARANDGKHLIKLWKEIRKGLDKAALELKARALCRVIAEKGASQWETGAIECSLPDLMDAASELKGLYNRSAILEDEVKRLKEKEKSENLEIESMRKLLNGFISEKLLAENARWGMGKIL